MWWSWTRHEALLLYILDFPKLTEFTSVAKLPLSVHTLVWWLSWTFRTGSFQCMNYPWFMDFYAWERWKFHGHAWYRMRSHYGYRSCLLEIKVFVFSSVICFCVSLKISIPPFSCCTKAPISQTPKTVFDCVRQNVLAKKNLWHPLLVNRIFLYWKN